MYLGVRNLRLNYKNLLKLRLRFDFDNLNQYKQMTNLDLSNEMKRNHFGLNV